MSLASKIMKLEASLTSDDFHPENGTILIVSKAGVESIASWKHKTVKQPSDSAINAITDKTILDEDNMKILRMERNNKLKESDWMANSDVSMSSSWKTYRQELRDLTNGLDTEDKVNKVTWPKEPS